MRWEYSDPNGYIYWKRSVPSKSKKWSKSDFIDNRGNELKDQAIFNYHFGHAGTVRMTKMELTYLHSLIEEYKEVGNDPYRKLEVWRALNWAPVSEQFAYVLPAQYNLQKYVVDSNVKVRRSSGKNITGNFDSDFKGVWVEPFNETISGANDETIMSYYVVTPNSPYPNYPNHHKSKIKNLMPSFVLKRVAGEWWTSMDVTTKDGTMPEKYFKKNDKFIKNPIINPFFDEKSKKNLTNNKGEIIGGIGNLDNLIQAKMYGWKINGQEIPDQEIVHYIRIKYGFAHAVNQSYNTESGLPQAHWYTIPFYDDEPFSPINLGGYIYNSPGNLILVDKETTQLQLYTNLLQYYSAYVKDTWLINKIELEDSVLSVTRKPMSDELNKDKKPNNFSPTWNQIFYFSTIRAYWRAHMILAEVTRYSKHIEEGRKSGDILTVAGEISSSESSTDLDDALNAMGLEENTPASSKKSNVIFFISGKKDGTTPENASDHPDAESRVSARIGIPKVSEHHDYHERPWNHHFKYSKEGKNVYASDRNVHKKNECFSQTQYLRNIILPNVTPYISDQLYTEKQITYTRKALGNLSLFHKPFLSEYLNTSGLNLLEKVAIQRILGSFETEDYSQFVSFLKKNKTGVFGVGIGLLILMELVYVGTSGAASGSKLAKVHHAFHELIFALESLLTGYKAGTNLLTHHPVKAARDLTVGGFSLYLGHTHGKIPIGPGFVIPGASFIMIGITIAIFLYDRWGYSKDKLAEMDKLVKLFNEATELDLLEGPFAQTKGVLKIKKGTDGSLPIGVKISPDGKTITNEYENFQSTSTTPSSETQQQKIERLNKEFLETNSRWETKFFNQLEKIECKTLLDIAKKTTQPGRFNPVLNDAPSHLDVGAFKPKESGQLNGINTKELFKNLELYFTYGLNDVQNIEPDYALMDISGQFESRQNPEFRKILEPRILNDFDQKIISTPFKYTRIPVTSKTNLEKYLKGIAEPSEFIAVRPVKSMGSITDPYTRSTTLYKWSANIIPNAGPYEKRISYGNTVSISDKEKVYLIRKKYGLDEVLPGGNCCSVFDVRADKNIFPITTDCQYLYDFTSQEFIKKLEEFCGKKEEEDKNKENEKKNKATIDDKKPATTHGQTEEKRVQHAVKMDDARKQDDRRNQKRNTAGYQGTPDSIQNLAQAPRLGVQALIPGNISYDLPITDSESQQRIAFETLDTERDKTSSLIANLVINLVGSLARKSISESLYASRNPPSKPAVPPIERGTQVTADKPFVLVSDGGQVYAQYYEPSTGTKLYRVPYSPKKK